MQNQTLRNHKLKPIAITIYLTILFWLSINDHRYNLLPDSGTLILVWLGLLVNCIPLFITPEDAIIGAASGYMFVRILHDGQKLIRNVEGIGLGDAKLLAAVGSWFGWQCLPVVVTAGALATLLLYAISRTRRNNLPFGVGISIAAASLPALTSIDSIAFYWIQ